MRHATREQDTDPGAARPRRSPDIVGGPARVLEPSPPAVVDEWFADDPAVGPGIAPVPNADTTWEKWVADHPEHAAWAVDRWLAAYRRLPELPAETATTRLALHRLAAYVLSPARRRVNGKIGLRWALGGFGTPFFGADEQIRIAGTALVRQRGDGAETEPITTLRAAAAFVLDDDPDIAWAAQFDVPPAGDVDEPLPVDPTAAGFLADWYGFACSVLEELRNDGRSVRAEPGAAVAGALRRQRGVPVRRGRAAGGFRRVAGRHGSRRALPLRRAVALRPVAGERLLERIHLPRGDPPVPPAGRRADQRADALAFFRTAGRTLEK